MSAKDLQEMFQDYSRPRKLGSDAVVFLSGGAGLGGYIPPLQ